MQREILTAIGDALVGRGWKLATAESCTGGLVAHWITSQPGCSGWFCGGVVAYADTTKTALLGVPDGMILSDGAVSASVAIAMAEGACQQIPEADIAVSLTGIAGPGGGQPGKPVGLVYVSVATVYGAARSQKLLFAGTRAEIQIAAGNAALEMVYNVLCDDCISRL